MRGGTSHHPPHGRRKHGAAGLQNGALAPKGSLSRRPHPVIFFEGRIEVVSLTLWIPLFFEATLYRFRSGGFTAHGSAATCRKPFFLLPSRTLIRAAREIWGRTHVLRVRPLGSTSPDEANRSPDYTPPIPHMLKSGVASTFPCCCVCTFWSPVLGSISPCWLVPAALV